MKKLIINILLTVSLFGAMGDCLTCHPKLLPTIDTDVRHSPMRECIKCHTPNETARLECGEKCFSCHSKDDLSDVKEHESIEECRACHIDAIHNLFDTSIKFDQSQGESLQNFLLK